MAAPMPRGDARAIRTHAMRPATSPTGFDAANGNLLLKKALGDPIGGGVSTYMLDGIQYIAVAGGMKNPIVQTESVIEQLRKLVAAPQLESVLFSWTCVS